MEIKISGHHVTVTEALDQHVRQKFQKIASHFDQVLNTHVILTVENNVQKAEANIHIKGKDLFAEVSNSDLYVAIDELSDVLNRQVIKYKEKVQDHHKA